MSKEQFQEFCRLKKAEGWNVLQIAKHIKENHQPELSIPCLRSRVSRYLNSVNELKSGDFDFSTKTETNQYDETPAMSAMKPDGTVMTLKEWCEYYGVPYDESKSYKLVTHTGVPRYNVASQNINGDSGELTVEEIKELIQEDLGQYQWQMREEWLSSLSERDTVVKISDLHFGAYIDGLIKTKKFSIGILADLLNDAVEIINRDSTGNVHVHIHGDLIESFTGLNHKNSWKGLQKSMIGAEVVKLCATVLHKEFLNKINNLSTVKIVAGNHDRVTSNKDEDTDGDAANLIAWGLSLMDYNVQFDPFVITHVVDGISHVIMHGDKAIAKKSTKDICWDYGTPGMYNVVAEGHLHALIEKASVAQRNAIKLTRDDAVDHVRLTLRSFFTGNSFSEYLGFSSQSGFSIIKNNGKGVPNIFHYAL